MSKDKCDADDRVEQEATEADNLNLDNGVMVDAEGTSSRCHIFGCLLVCFYYLGITAMELFAFLMGIRFIPKLGNILSGKYPLVSIRQSNWMKMCIMVGLAYITIGNFYDLRLQQAINWVREICRCDLIYIVRRSDIAEAVMVYLKRNSPEQIRNYFICRSVCP